MTNKKMIEEFKEEFKEATSKWAEEMNTTKQKQYIVCRCNPDDLTQLVKAIEELEEKVWRTETESEQESKIREIIEKYTYGFKNLKMNDIHLQEVLISFKNEIINTYKEYNDSVK